MPIASALELAEGDAGTTTEVVLDPEMQHIFRLIERLGPSTLPVLLLGETGSGKEVLANKLHRTSCLCSRPLIRINCAGLAESVVESELFGHERGAFTGAHQARRGLFAMADGGTLFLDELAELSPRTQAKLLRVLESGEFSALGSTAVQRVKVRLVAATHADLRLLIERGAFRRDLYFRLSGLTIAVPPLRQRRTEILPLARLFLNRAAGHLGRPDLHLTSSAERALSEYDWPGNIRELRNVIECAAALCVGTRLTLEALRLGHPMGGLEFAGPAGAQLVTAPGASALEGIEARHFAAWDEPAALAGSGRTRSAAAPAEASPRVALKGELEHFERNQILAALAESGGNQTRAARLLGISRRTLTNKLTRHDLPRPRKSSARAPGSADVSE